MIGPIGLYDPEYEKDSCGVGLAVNIDGRKEHRIVDYGLRILDNMEHRGAENADGKTGDGTGITVQIPHAFFVSLGIRVPEAGKYGAGLVFLPRDEGSAQSGLSPFPEAVIMSLFSAAKPAASSNLGMLVAVETPWLVVTLMTPSPEEPFFVVTITTPLAPRAP